MFQGFYILTEDVFGEAICPDGWYGGVTKDTPVALTYFDESGMEFTDGRNEFRLCKPCPIVAACSCPSCGMIVRTVDLAEHLQSDSNCWEIRRMSEDKEIHD